MTTVYLVDANKMFFVRELLYAILGYKLDAEEGRLPVNGDRIPGLKPAGFVILDKKL